MEKLEKQITKMGDQALAASRKLINFSTNKKNLILLSMADELNTQRKLIQTENAKDLAAAEENGLSKAMIDRLTLNDERIDGMINGIREVAELKDPVGKKIWKRIRPNGLIIEKKRVPLGVVCIIFESRPNVTADAAVLCFKTSNAVILRGGKEAFYSNTAIAAALQKGGAAAGMPKDAIQLVSTIDREAVRILVQLDGKIDVVIPRGGESLIKAVVSNATIPVLKHYKGVCHLYVEKEADIEKALAIAENAKCQRPGVCNAIETLLVDKEIAARFLPLLKKMADRCGVEIHGCKTTCNIIPGCTPATEDDWYEEYLDMILAVKVVSNTKVAIEHINTYGSHHSDAIVTEDKRSANKFLKEIDSSSVYVNASTRFTDGAMFGMGAEMGISTDKLHARGPMGLEELTTYKYTITGTGQIR
ncbi:MAG: glutamate-5-semialdehyde dehydrogenase [Kiritimatiellae bacterium]|jgi:glutamate-5-semialdehyde dehydrogenase|nr:glutamate-5-semialdehyde dehydrogenase [Kiritimatiellia bacterium]